MNRRQRRSGLGPWVLVTEGAGGQSRAAVAAVRALASEGYRPAVTICSHLSLARASRACAQHLVIPPADRDPQAYARAIELEAERLSAVAVFPASDLALLALGFPVRHLVNKITCAEKAREAGLKTPPSRVFASAAEVLDCARELEYPVVVKPDFKRAFATRVDAPAQLEKMLGAMLAQPGRVIVQPFLGNEFRAIVGLMWQKEMLLAMHMRYQRLWPAVCGTVASAVTIAPDRELETRMERLLAGYDGIFHAEFAAANYLLDLNPRVHATLPLAIAAGINPVARYCDLRQGCEVRWSRARPGVFFRWMEGDFRSLLYELRSGRISLRAAVKALRPKPQTVHSYESLRDPGPLWERLRFVWAKLQGKDVTNAGETVPEVLASPADEDGARGAAVPADQFQRQADQGVLPRCNFREVEPLDNYGACR